MKIADIEKNYKIILASSSKRRIKLLKQIFDNFSCINHKYTEKNIDTDDEKIIKNTVEQNSIGKLKSILELVDKQTLVISSDTLAFCCKKALIKPETADQAKEQLFLIKNKKVIIGSSVTVFFKQKIITKSTINYVYMDDYDNATIDWYTKTGEPIGKTGSFAIQKKGIQLIKKIDGDFFSIVGLPLFKLLDILKSL